MSPPTARRDPEATREAILDAAQAVIVEKGFSAASTSEIARRAGVTKSLIHHHFGSKEELWGVVKDRCFEEYGAVQMRMLQESKPDAELLMKSVEMFYRFLQSHPEMVRVMTWVNLEGDFSCSDPMQELYRVGIERIHESQESGALRQDVDPGLMLFMFKALASYWFQAQEHYCHDAAITTPLPELNETYLEDMMKVFFEGVLPR